MDFRFSEEDDRFPRLKESNRRVQHFLDYLSSSSQRLREHIRSEGLINIPLEVFRYQNRVIKVTRKIESAGIDDRSVFRALTVKQLPVFLKSILQQLAQLHEIGFIHGDLKKENILIARKRENIIVGCIIDFDTGLWEGEQDWAGKFEFSPETASPEVCALQVSEGEKTGLKTLTARADIYSLGCVFAEYFLAAPLRMYGYAPGIYQSGQMDGGPVYLPPIPPFWRTLIREMMAKAPKERPSAGDLVFQINHAIESGAYQELELQGIKDMKTKILNGQIAAFLFAPEGITVSWHVDNGWVYDTEGNRSVPALEAHDQRARRIQARMARIRQLTGSEEILGPMELIREGHILWVRQNLPHAGKIRILSAMNQGFSPQTADQMMKMILRGMEQLHRKGYVFGNLSLDNIWIVQQGEKTTLRIMGLHNGFFLNDIPQPEEFYYPVSIQAPEFYLYLGTCKEDERHTYYRGFISPRSDIFSLGCIYHFLLTGNLPSAVQTDQINNIQEAAYENAIQLDSRVDGERRRMIAEMLSADEHERPESCLELIRRIDSLA